MGIVKINTKNKKTLKMVAECLDVTNDPISSAPLVLKFDAYLEDEKGGKKILQCMQYSERYLVLAYLIPMPKYFSNIF